MPASQVLGPHRRSSAVGGLLSRCARPPDGKLLEPHGERHGAVPEELGGRQWHRVFQGGHRDGEALSA